MRWKVLVALAPLLFGGGVLQNPPQRSTAPQVTVVAESALQPEDDRPGVATPTPAEVIAKSGPRALFGAASDGRVLLAWSASFGHFENRAFWTAYRIMDGDRVVSERLLSRTPASDYFVTVEPLPGGFLVGGYAQPPRFVSSSGARSYVRMLAKPTRLRPGDRPVGIRGWLYRPLTKTVYTAVRAPGGTLAEHIDGNGSWWALGDIESGQQVLWSQKPGEKWIKHLVGTQVPYAVRCTCPWAPSVEGRGPVVVASMGPLNHVSLDSGATWHTYDLGDSEPFQTIYGRLREPITSALPDGRIVTGYIQFWVADAASNTSFRPTTLRSLNMWRAGLSAAPVRRGDTVSLDGGQTWVPIGPDSSRMRRPTWE